MFHVSNVSVKHYSDYHSAEDEEVGDSLNISGQSLNGATSPGIFRPKIRYATRATAGYGSRTGQMREQ